jgi:hypothetical protein
MLEWLGIGAVAPALLVVALDGRPVRFGAPVPAAAVATGLRLEGQGVLQWRPLATMPVDADPVWVEIAILGPRGTVRVCAGGPGPTLDGRGPAFVRDDEERAVAGGSERTLRWRWADGTVDELVRTAFAVPAEVDGECFAPGEALTRASPGLDERALALLRLPRAHWAAVGLLPERGAGGVQAQQVRAHVQRLLPLLQELPGRRGAGDYARSGGVVTNLEYDTTLALLHCALALGDAPAFGRAVRAARHLRDRDLDPQTGLPFPHGQDHRCGVPEPGHAWLQGLLWCGLLTAADDHVAAARALGRALAAHPPRGAGAGERLRDFAWPLLELEALLTLAPDPIVARAADRLANSIARRFDPVARTWRFGEGEVGGGVYFERAWLTAGILVPALRAHVRRTGDAGIERQLAAATALLVDRIAAGRGLPTHWRTVRGLVFAEHRVEGTAEAACLLEALPPADLQRLLRKSTVRAGVIGFPRPDDPDLPTQLSLLARCWWPWR